MKNLKNKKGFTLIELLAVIVVLAIVTVLATTTMLPLMNRAIKSSFVDEANAARESAANVMTLISIDSFDIPVEGADYQDSSTKTCISLKKMAEEGLYDKDIEFFNKKGDATQAEYEGKVIITKASGASNNYTYQVVMHNDNYVTKEGVTGKISDSDVEDYKLGDKTSSTFQCSEEDLK